MLPNVKIIVSGTRFSFDLSPPVYSSGIGKRPATWDVVYIPGDFAN
jgi:hypothetical protein